MKSKAEISPTLECMCVQHVLPNVEVLHIDILVGSGLPLAPQEKTLLCRGLCRDEKVQKRWGGGELEHSQYLLISLSKVFELFYSINVAQADRKILQRLVMNVLNIDSFSSPQWSENTEDVFCLLHLPEQTSEKYQSLVKKNIYIINVTSYWL